MVSFDEAYKKALELNKKLNACNEYKDAFHFYEEVEDNVDGGDGPVILKETGEAIHFVTFIHRYHPEKTPKKVVIPRKVKRS